MKSNGSNAHSRVDTCAPAKEATGLAGHFVCPLCRSRSYSTIALSRGSRAGSKFHKCSGCNFYFFEPGLVSAQTDKS